MKMINQAKKSNHQNTNFLYVKIKALAIYHNCCDVVNSLNKNFTILSFSLYDAKAINHKTNKVNSHITTEPGVSNKK